jgi:hypothetical protein
MIEHHIVAVAFTTIEPPCVTCTGRTPHNIVAKCGCGQTAAGMTPHIWTVTERAGENLVTLMPSFNWLNDPRDPSKGSHLHENVSRIPVMHMDEMHERWPRVDRRSA